MQRRREQKPGKTSANNKQTNKQRRTNEPARRLHQRRERALNARLQQNEVTHVFDLAFGVVHEFGDRSYLHETCVQVFGLFATSVFAQFCQQQIVAWNALDLCVCAQQTKTQYTKNKKAKKQFLSK
jgi:hypothetical protein